MSQTVVNVAGIKNPTLEPRDFALFWRDSATALSIPWPKLHGIDDVPWWRLLHVAAFWQLIFFKGIVHTYIHTYINYLVMQVYLKATNVDVDLQL